MAPQLPPESEQSEKVQQIKVELPKPKSQPRVIEKSTQTPDKKADLYPETTHLIDISPSKQSLAERNPSYKATGRYSEKKSPPFGERLNLKSVDQFVSPINQSTSVSDTSNFRDNRNSTEIEYKPSYEQFSHTTFQNNSGQADR